MSKKIRIWKLGSLEHKISPSKELIKDFKKILHDVYSGKTTDIIWGPAIEVMELDIDSSDINIVTDEQS